MEYLLVEALKEGENEIDRNKVVNVPKGARKNKKSKRTK